MPRGRPGPGGTSSQGVLQRGPKDMPGWAGVATRGQAGTGTDPGWSVDARARDEGLGARITHALSRGTLWRGPPIRGR